MKPTLIPLLFIMFLLTSSCSKEEDCYNPVDCLPAATQTGANTAGCLVDGQVFLPGGQSLNSGSVLKAQYVFHNGKYIFGVSIRNRNNGNKMVMIESKDEKLEEGDTYSMKKSSDISTTGVYLNGLIGYSTTDEVTGEFTITNLDESNRILSGTFWFDAVNNNAEIVKVRNGRFDVRY
ncbi:DUF6252 family protein [Salegentibacter sp. UBA1130]|uniref:DUF6252 family protein n=1 Tax=Salegentibacter sp. UBA1130 TaxID=1947451 RepID=UPI00257A095D|nr:DUF6252 family protein [Salegentibacter sp. UBA1130]